MTSRYAHQNTLEPKLLQSTRIACICFPGFAFHQLVIWFSMPVLTKSGWNCQSAGGKRCFRWASKLFLTSMGKSGICNSSWGSATPFKASWTRRTPGATVTLTTKSRVPRILKFSTPTVVIRPRLSCGLRIYIAKKVWCYHSSKRQTYFIIFDLVYHACFN